MTLGRGVTPAMAASIAQKPWTVADVVTMLEIRERETELEKTEVKHRKALGFRKRIGGRLSGPRWSSRWRGKRMISLAISGEDPQGARGRG
jgi:hypothetical protein